MGEFGIINGAGAAPEPNTSPRLPCPGAISPVDGVAENKEFCPDDCAEAASGPANERMSASTEPSAGHSRRGVPNAVALLMTWSFSAQIAAISSQLPRFVTPIPLC
jgi:hypothetical protein